LFSYERLPEDDRDESTTPRLRQIDPAIAQARERTALDIDRMFPRSTAVKPHRPMLGRPMDSLKRHVAG
jgi:hypothetical protein